MVNPLDDSQLLRLASDPRTRLFPPLRGATVFGPLVVLTGLAPFLVAMLGTELGDNSAGWGLRAIDVMSAVSIQECLEPGHNGLGRGYVHQPPLSSWLLAVTAPCLGTDQLLSWRILSATAQCLAIWAMYLLGRRLGGASFGLITALALCGHPVMLRIATVTNPAAVGSLLLIIAVWGYLGHLEGPPQLVSLRMLAGSVAWGLSLLAVGPVALALFVPMLIHAWLLNAGLHDREHPARSRMRQLWLGLRTLAVFVMTALSFSGWWQLMMLTSYGSEFLNSWWSGQVAMSFPADTPKSYWRECLSQNSFLVGWLIVGLVRGIGELRRPSSELERRRSQFVLVWWSTAVVIRIVFDIPALRRCVLMDAWDVFLLLPTVLLAAMGIKAFVLRQTSQLTEGLLLAAPLGLYVWRLTLQPWLGLTAFVLGLGFLALLPALSTRIRGGARQWTERDWKRLLRIAFLLVAGGHIAAGLSEFPRFSLESQSLVELRKRIAPVPPTPRVTLMTSNGAAPESLLFVLRSRWPASTFVLAGLRDGRLAREPSEAAPPVELVIEWTKHDIRIANELPANRQATAIGDPLRFRERRLMIYRVGPRQR